MPELAIARDRNLNLPAFKPLVLDNNIAPQTFVPDMRQAIADQAKGASMGAIGKAIASIPDLILESYEKGRKLRQQGENDKLVSDAIAGKGSNTLASLGYKADGKGGYTLNPGTHDKTTGSALQRQIDQNLKEKGALDKAFNSNSGVAPSAAPAPEPALPTDAVDTTDVPMTDPQASVSGSVFGRVPDGSGGWMQDPNDITDANVPGFSASKGAWGANIQDPELAGAAVTPASLKAAGIDPNNAAQVASHHVQVQTPDGRTLTYPIVDKLGKDGRIDFTPKAYTEIGGPMTKGGGLVQGLKYSFVPASPQAGVSPEIQAQALESATAAGDQLTAIPDDTLSVANTPGQPIPVAPVANEVQGPLANLPLAAKGAAITPGRPLEGFDPTLPYGDMKGAPVAPVAPQAFDPTKPVSRPTIGKSPVTGNTLYSPTPGNLIEYNSEGGKTALKPDTSYLAAQKAIDAKAKSQPIPANIRSEAIRMQVPIDGRTADQVGHDLDARYIDQGIIPQRLLPVGQSMARLIINHPTLKHLPTIREAKEAVDAGLANPDAGGFSDMALIEGFQRMVNPGATVRTQTMQNMKEAAGWLQQLDPRFQWEKATSGDKFTPEARQRLHKLSDDIYERALKNAAPQLSGLKRQARSYGISNPDAFIDNVFAINIPLLDTGGSEVPVNPTGQTPLPVSPATTPMAGGPAAATQSAKVKMRSPDGTEAYVNPDAVEKYKVKGATVVQ